MPKTKKTITKEEKRSAIEEFNKLFYFEETVHRLDNGKLAKIILERCSVVLKSIDENLNRYKNELIRATDFAEAKRNLIEGKKRFVLKILLGGVAAFIGSGLIALMLSFYWKLW